MKSGMRLSGRRLKRCDFPVGRDINLYIREENMTEIRLDLQKIRGKMKPVHGVGQPPFSGTDYSMLHYLTEAGIPYSRLHDVGGIFGGGRFVDIPNIFRNFDANPYDPASYDFVFTDDLITHLMDSGVEPFFRLGVTIENYASMKAYRIYPPKDFRKWAVVCEHVIRHYTEGWADGFRYPIRYWEIWNEPENGIECTTMNQMWLGTDREYFELYDIASKHLKKCFPDLMIGGYASCGFEHLTNAHPSERALHWERFFNQFLAYIKESGAPLDFFSWHSYASIGVTMINADYVRKRLDEEGFTETESICNEWNYEAQLRGTDLHAALTAGMMISMQKSSLDSAMFYDARFGTSIYGGMFNPLTAKPFKAYYSFVAFNELYRLGTEITADCDTEGVYALAATDGKTAKLMLVSTLDAECGVKISGAEPVGKARKLTEEGFMEVEFSGKLAPFGVYLFDVV